MHHHESAADKVPVGKTFHHIKQKRLCCTKSKILLFLDISRHLLCFAINAAFMGSRYRSSVDTVEVQVL